MYSLKKNLTKILSSDLIKMFELSPMIIIKNKISKDGFNLCFVSININNLTGYSYQEFVNKKVYYSDIIHFGDRDDVIKKYNEFLNNDLLNIQLSPYRIISKNGKVIWVRDILVKLKDENNEKYIINYIFDISDVVQAEICVSEYNKKLIATQEKLNLTLETTDSGLWEFNLKTRTFIFDKSTLKMLGYNHKDIKESVIFFNNIIHEDDRYIIRSKVFSIYRKETDVLSVRIRVKTKFGFWKWVHIKGRVIDYDSYGNPIKILGLQLDISDFLETQSSLSEARIKAEESDKLKSAFLTNISHEIRTPMNVILGFAEILAETDYTKEEAREYVNIIKDNGNDLLHLIDNIIDFSKIKSNQIDVCIERCNLYELIDDLYKKFELKLIHKDSQDVQLLVNRELDDKYGFIYTDSMKLYKIYYALIDNALKFTKKGFIKFGYKLKKRNEIIFYVEDSGIGMNSKELEIIFENFRQIDYSKNRQYEGVGLGLSLAKEYVSMLGGKIWVKSQEKIGTTFYFTIPYNYL